jgi:AcrR family transcriptional regulator
VSTPEALGGQPSADDAAAKGQTNGETKGERTRRRLLELAIAHFGSKGFRATSVSEIARAAGLTQAAVYAYFSNKEEFFIAAVDADATSLIAESRAAVAGTPIRQFIPAWIVELFSRLDRHPLARRVLAGQEPEVVARLIELPALAAATAQFERELREAQARGEVRADVDARRIAAGAEALIVSLLFTTVQVGGLATRRHQSGVVEAFDAMLRPS